MLFTFPKLHIVKSFQHSCFSPPPRTGVHDVYDAVRKVRRGKYSEVVEGIHATDNETYVIKILKPVKKKQVRQHNAKLTAAAPDHLNKAERKMMIHRGLVLTGWLVIHLMNSTSVRVVW
ncbi:hypothetical protein DY000_02055691 [Brassica cretica]|uniref:non-specific serine/threonine protein kinase n=1 Tax=Brassica cretica TaxID=69181 RepID=A0ABQ7AGE2_BRACR|nr:hypothetical protein DY000_02055691 [Brassica cretica]